MSESARQCALGLGTLMVLGCQQGYVISVNQKIAACRPVVGNVQPMEAQSLRWKWDSGSAAEFNQTMVTPMVADLNADGVSDFVFSSFKGAFYTSAGVLRAVSGRDGTELWSSSGSGSENQPHGVSTPAIYDLDRDGVPEILIAGPSALLVYGNSGQLIDRQPTAASLPATSRISVADIDFDGVYEIMIGMSNSTYLFRYDFRKGTLSAPLLSHVLGMMDVDPSSAGMEVITSTAIYSSELEKLHDLAFAVAGVKGTMAAYGNFDDEPDTELVVSHGGPASISVFKGSTGSLLTSWRESADENAACQARSGRVTSSLGAPNVGDIDGDSRPDITFAGTCWFRALRSDGKNLKEQWKLETRDFSSSVTGSSIFDFNGDGRVEVLYNDELYFRILDGRSGEVIYALPNDNGTLWENPVVVSLRSNEPASIVISANSYTSYSQRSDPPLSVEDPQTSVANVTGVRVIQGGDNLWMPTRTLWNEFDYRVTQVLDNLQIPTSIPDFVGLSNHTRSNIPRIVQRCE